MAEINAKVEMREWVQAWKTLKSSHGGNDISSNYFQAREIHNRSCFRCRHWNVSGLRMIVAVTCTTTTNGWSFMSAFPALWDLMSIIYPCENFGMFFLSWRHFICRELRKLK
ncbi:hypothetical protein N7508_010041 [Penicillium antarcticum]|uniref:uncharacterized protein n=1 Tax=Penicillium antarcticum TaxID=416450 RepID=UPI00238B22D3|nr:uncharacterized protein N7508_010041 [Penicillium antarcticum]KAJ5295220.1 hypothetical protein N7508_010041 [Penicillium antarcticum]